MELLLSILKPIDAPGSIPFLILCLAVGLIVMIAWPKRRRFARLWLLCVATGYVLLAMPVVAHFITSRLPRFQPDEIPTDRPLDALIVFDGDNRRGRVNESVRAFVAAGPAEVWVLGVQDWLMNELPVAGIPQNVLHHDDTTGTTRAQMTWIRRYLAAHPGANVAIVASRLQMPRVAALAHADGIEAALLASAVDKEPPVKGARVLVPMYIALRVSRDALYEHAALVYYRHNGWIEKSSF